MIVQMRQKLKFKDVASYYDSTILIDLSYFYLLNYLNSGVSDYKSIKLSILLTIPIVMS